VSDTVLVPLYDRHGAVVAYAQVDPADGHLTEHRWCRGRNGYAMRNAHAEDGVRRAVYMHREIVGLVHGDGLEADHRNGDKLDNRRSNLRVVTRAENCQNITSGGWGASRYRGVTWDATRGKWVAQAKLRGRNHHLGRYAREEDAAAAAAAFRAVHMPFSGEAAA
jgi:HNH endonuclease